MLQVQEAIERLLSASFEGPECERIDLLQATGRVLAEDVVAVLNVPPADNSAMDGYAVRVEDARAAGGTLPVSTRVPAGQAPSPLKPGTAARIFTGAEIPPGADAVVMQENCDAEDGNVIIRQMPEPGQNIRPRAQDIAAGDALLPAGHRLRPQDMGLLASQGLGTINVYRRVRAAVLSTGDELVEPGKPVGPGQIYNSNRYTMTGLLQDWGMDVVDLGVAPDDPARIEALFREAAEAADVLVCSGGVSVGEEDHVKPVVEKLGSLDLWRIAIKPGKPFAFGSVCGKPFIGLPGNPVSGFVTLLIIGRPFLFRMQGMAASPPIPAWLPARFNTPGSSREGYLRARYTDGGVELFGNQSSGVLMSTSRSDGLVRQPVDTDIAEGDRVEFLPYASFN
ncbi:molybdopterin molybdotransferase MoeA [Elongatibacter sediminis]|uniref:Molybdopterin molybdenumtransferase n=1 Tax=Elongatibacter sediminis TaxID=3119006 RepID=A0AAW9R653_9GAMM